jgi:hypothetical protein
LGWLHALKKMIHSQKKNVEFLEKRGGIKNGHGAEYRNETETELSYDNLIEEAIELAARELTEGYSYGLAIVYHNEIYNTT